MSTDQLKALEEWFLAVCRNPDHDDCCDLGHFSDFDSQLPAGFASFNDLIEPSSRLTSAERLNIYANMYFWRLIDAVATDYPCIEHAIGETHFRSLIREFLVAHPSRSYTLNILGAKFPEFLADQDIEHKEFLSELATLEWALVEVFHAEESTLLDSEALAKLSMEAWAETVLRPVHAFRLFAFEYPTNPYFQSFRDDQNPVIPSEDKTYVAVIRNDLTLWRYDIEYGQYLILQACSEGKTLLEALEYAAEFVDPDQLLPNLQNWFAEWTQDGFFQALSSQPTLDS